MSTPLPPSTPSEPAPMYRQHPLRIGCVQFDAKLGDIDNNAAKVERMTAGLRPGMVDLLVLPEMALSGYMFNNPGSILPYLEPYRVGPTSRLATSLAQRLKCYVVAGYPEVIEPGDGGRSAKLKEVEAEGQGVGYNSALLADPNGQLVGNYRKTFRFETDKNWAREGDGFTYFDLPAPLGRVAIGICMDLNPRDFIAPWDAFELASYCADNKVDLLVMPMNWLDPAEQDIPEGQEGIPHPDLEAPSESNLNYWAARLTPLHDPTPAYASACSSTTADPRGTTKQLVFVAANRVGVEEGTRFCGTSAVMTVSSCPSQIELIECCNRSEERVMIAEVA